MGKHFLFIGEGGAVQCSAAAAVQRHGWVAAPVDLHCFTLGCPFAGSGASGGGNNSFSGLTMPFRGADRTEASARPASSPSFSNSPVTGLLYIRGIIGKQHSYCSHVKEWR